MQLISDIRLSESGFVNLIARLHLLVKSQIGGGTSSMFQGGKTAISGEVNADRISSNFSFRRTRITKSRGKIEEESDGVIRHP